MIVSQKCLILGHNNHDFSSTLRLHKLYLSKQRGLLFFIFVILLMSKKLILDISEGPQVHKTDLYLTICKEYLNVSTK